MGAVAGALGVGVNGCHKDEASDDLAPTPNAIASVAPVDHLAPGELVEGSEKMFGVPLPRELVVERQFVDVGYASGEPGRAAVARYFSTRVQGGKVTTGDRGAIFDSVHAAADPNRLLRIEVTTANDGPFAGRGSQVTIRDITAPKLPDEPNEEARWKAAGLKPDGTLLDPQHLK
ncbi:MAG: hypothetical protein ABI183_20855 [Polyangiaceae bacterium]